MAKLGGIYRPTYTEAGPDGARVQRTSAKWAYRFEHRGRTYQAAGFATQAAAARARDARRAEVQAGHEQDWRRLTLDGVRLMREARGVEWAKTTRANFRGAWQRLFRFFRPDECAADVDDTRILGYVAFSRQQGNARNTTAQDLVQLRAALELAHRKRVLPYVPEFPKAKPEPRQQTIAPVQLEQILAAMKPYWRLYYEAAAATGWRAASELRTRKWGDVDWGPREWTCCHMKVTADACACGAGRPGWLSLDAASTKTKTARLFPMTRALRSILTRARIRCDAVQLRAGSILSWIFVRDDGRQLPAHGPAWRRALRKLGVKPVGESGKPWSGAMVPHDIRRSWIRQQKRAGMEKEARKKLVGHASDSAHAGYLEQGPDLHELRAAALELDRQAGETTADNVVQLSLWKSAR